MFSSGDKQSVVEASQEEILVVPKIRSGNLIKVRPEYKADSINKPVISIWELPANCPKNNHRLGRTKILVPDFHRAQFKVGHLTPYHPPVLYLGQEVHPETDDLYHPESFVAHFFLHKGKVWFKTSSCSHEVFESFKIEDIFEAVS